MEELMEILENLRPDVDFEKEKALIDDEILSSFDVVTLVAKINDEFDVDVPVSEIVPENFNSAKALYAVIEKLQNE